MQRALNKYPNVFNKTARSTLIVYGNKMANSARSDHRYNNISPKKGKKKYRPSGNLDRSIESVVGKKLIFLKFWINPKLVTSGKYNYGLIQHEGSYTGYKKSKATKKRYGGKTPKTKGAIGILADHFMVRAWNKHYKNMKAELRKDLMQAAKKLRLA